MVYFLVILSYFFGEVRPSPALERAQRGLTKNTGSAMPQRIVVGPVSRAWATSSEHAWDVFC
jgi:hypothetical protein